MNKLVKLVVLGFVIIGISACGQTGDLTRGDNMSLPKTLTETGISPYRSK
ncbi:MAG: hypothetical protein HAW58_02210 [Candidatus Thioglobus sp.]|nr:hypothetical protein [Candidatus Thioglobus sp.]